MATLSLPPLVEAQPLTPIAAAVATASTATRRSRRERVSLIGGYLSIVDRS